MATFGDAKDQTEAARTFAAPTGSEASSAMPLVTATHPGISAAQSQPPLSAYPRVQIVEIPAQVKTPTIHTPPYVPQPSHQLPYSLERQTVTFDLPSLHGDGSEKAWMGSYAPVQSEAYPPSAYPHNSGAFLPITPPGVDNFSSPRYSHPSTHQEMLQAPIYHGPSSETSSLSSWDGGMSSISRPQTAEPPPLPISSARNPMPTHAIVPSQSARSSPYPLPQPRASRAYSPIPSLAPAIHPPSGSSVTQAVAPPTPPVQEWDQYSIPVQGTNQYRCVYPDCARTDQPFPSKKAVDVHIKGKHLQMRSNVCPDPECGRSFSRAFDLKRHLRSHSEDRPYVCQVCGIAYKRADMLSRHRSASRQCQVESSDDED